MSENKRFKKGDFEEDSPRFIPWERGDVNYNLFDIVDTKRLDYVSFIIPYSNSKECERDCNIMNMLDYLLKERFLCKIY